MTITLRESKAGCALDTSVPFCLTQLKESRSGHAMEVKVAIVPKPHGESTGYAQVANAPFGCLEGPILCCSAYRASTARFVLDTSI